jgi:hypothetical protein
MKKGSAAVPVVDEGVGGTDVELRHTFVENGTDAFGLKPRIQQIRGRAITDSGKACHLWNLNAPKVFSQLMKIFFSLAEPDDCWLNKYERSS